MVELEPACVERVDLRVEAGRIVARGEALEPAPDDEVIDLSGKVVMPGLVCGHARLRSVLTRAFPSSDSMEYLSAREARWSTEAALDSDALELSAAVGAYEALCAGTTTLIDRHASPGAVRGSLVRLARGINQVGLRAVLSYEVTDRLGPELREAALEETVGFAQKAQGRFRGMVGAHASFTLASETLGRLAEAVARLGVGLDVELSEDPTDERLSQERFGAAPVSRLLSFGLLTPRSVVTHVVHLSWPDLAQVLATGSWLVHTPRSNMEHQVGYAPAAKLGARMALGSDGTGADLFDEARVAYLRAREAGQPVDVLRALANGQRMASEMFGLPIGPMREGAAADLLVLDYRPPAPFEAADLARHLLFGPGARSVESVMVDGIWRLWGRKALSIAPDSLAGYAREAAHAIRARLAEPEPVPEAAEG